MDKNKSYKNTVISAVNLNWFLMLGSIERAQANI